MKLQAGWSSTAVHCDGAATTGQRRLGQILKRAGIGMAVAILLTIPARAQTTPKNLGDTSIEDLMNIEVTSVSKKEQKLSRIASAIFVVTQEDIERSGATNIPDVLRMVPGLDVAQANGNTWEISSRGLNSQFANKLLVLIDGRAVYSPLFAGVYWDVQDAPLEDIERIEVIRGPGATAWGANAVNGVINIITKAAKDTLGGLLIAGSGTHEPGFGLAQYGGKIREGTAYSFFVKGSDYKAFPTPSGQGGHDGLDLLHGRFRLDSTLSAQDSLTLAGDLYKGHEESKTSIISLTPPFRQLIDMPSNLSGGNVLGRWIHTFSPHSETSLQVYFDRTERSNVIIEGQTANTMDVDFQHRVDWGRRQEIVWGLGYRYISYGTTGTLTASFNPASQGRQLFSSFVQEEIALLPERLHLTIGAKLEHNDFTGFELAPSVRITWNIVKDGMVWAGYSRAERTPSPVDRGINAGLAVLPEAGGLPVLLTARGSRDTVSENLDAFEAGYRTQLRNNVSLDFSVFYNRYGHLATVEPGLPFVELDPAPAHLAVPIFFANLMHGETHGLELAVDWKISPRWTLSPGYAFSRIHLRTDAASQDTVSVPTAEGNSPHVQAQLRSNVHLARGLEWNAAAYFVGRLPFEQVPSYTRLDTGITWRTSEHLSISLVGQNLLRDHHLEANSSDETASSSLIKRSAYAKFTWHF